MAEQQIGFGKPTCKHVRANGEKCKKRVAVGQGFCYWHAKSLPNKWRALTKNQTIIFGIGLLSLVIGLPGAWFSFRSWIRPTISEIRRASKEGVLEALKTVPADRPHIATRLVIDSVGRSELVFHLGLENIGRFQVNNIKCAYNTGEMVSNELIPFIPRTLPPGGHLSVQGLPITGLKKYKTLFVDLAYEGAPSEVLSAFTSRYRFSLPPGDLKPQTIDPDEWEEFTGNLAFDQNLEIIKKGLGASQGTLMLALPEHTTDGRPNVVLMFNSDRRFVFDPISQTVFFQTAFASRQTKAIRQQFRPTQNGLHIVTFTWDEQSVADLYIEGVKVSR
jgi:hypothetical protein